MSANSKASQLLNGFGNFLSANANAARDLIVDPVVDLGSYAAKGYARGGAMLLGKDPDKAAAAVDKVADVLKTGGGYNAKQEVDPTSIAGAIGDGLIRGVDQAAAVLTLTEAAKQLPKAAQKGWNKILNKVKDAKSKSQQMKLAKEAREYINNNIDALEGTDRKLFTSEAPSYQQRAAAKHAAERGSWDRGGSTKYLPAKGTPETYRGLYEPEPGQTSNIKNITEQFAEINSRKNWTDAEKDLAKQVATNDALTNGNTAGVREYVKQGIDANKQIFNMDNAAAARAGIPYGGKNMQNIRNVQKEVQDLVKMSDSDFKKLMQNKAAASTAGYGDWRYNLGDDWIHNWNNPKEYQRMKEQIVDNILNDAGLDYGISSAYGNAIKSNAAKSSKRYRNWLKKDMKNTYDTKTKGRTRQEARDIAEYRRKGSQGYTPAELRAMEREMLNDAEAEAADIAAGERAYKHEGIDPTIWF